jgi:hypothetical protein
MNSNTSTENQPTANMQDRTQISHESKNAEYAADAANPPTATARQNSLLTRILLSAFGCTLLARTVDREIWVVLSLCGGIICLSIYFFMRLSQLVNSRKHTKL